MDNTNNGFAVEHHKNDNLSSLSSDDAAFVDHTVGSLLVATVVDLLVCVATVPFSTINLVVIGRTSLLHPNLKVVLLWQSTFILMRGIVCLLIDVHKLASMEPYSVELLEPYRRLHVFAFFNRNFIAHVLIIERFMATAMVRTYEARKGWLFTCAWCILVFAVSLFHTIEMGPLFSTFASLLTESFLLIIGIGEWLFLARLWHFNEQRYKQSIGQSGLSERYQLSENIRTGKQLTPTLCFHFWMLFGSVLSAYWSYFDLPGFSHLFMAINIANGISGLAIETLMIVCHPFLKRDALFTIQRIFVLKLPKNRVHDEGQAMKCAKNSGRKSLAMRDLINGKAMIVSSMSQNIHFDSLRKCWEEGRQMNE